MSKQTKYTRSARGQDCCVRIPGVCNHNPETVVFAHLNGAGMGMKHADIHGAYACSNCHDFIDGRWSPSTPDTFNITRGDIMLMHYDGMLRTQQIMIRDGILKL